jgi:hypothetical protein
MSQNKSVLEKLGFKPGMPARLDSVPLEAEPLLTPAFGTIVKNPVWLIGFARNSADIARLANELTPAYPRGGHLWLCYPKKSGAIKSDLSRDVGWEPIFAKDLLAVTQISVDENWSALRFRYRDEIKTLTRRWAVGG